MTRFCPDCGKQINDASGCTCKMGKQLKEWMPENPCNVKRCEFYKRHGPCMSKDCDSWIEYQNKIAGARAVLNELINNGSTYISREGLKQMLKELEECK